MTLAQKPHRKKLSIFFVYSCSNLSGASEQEGTELMRFMKARTYEGDDCLWKGMSGD
jgi:hypothetical protein